MKQVLACLLSALGCFLSCALLGFPETGGMRFCWVLLWAVSSVAGLRFLRVRDRRARACFGVFGALFVLALALGYRLEAAGETGIDGLLLSLSAALCLGPAAGWAALWLDERMAALAVSPARVPRHALLAPMALMLLAWTPMLLAFYPGIHAYDTFAQIPEYLSGSFSTHHPLAHTLMTGWLYDLGAALGNPAWGMLAYSVLQMLLLAYALARGLAFLAGRGCPRWVRVGLLALMCLSPQYSLHALGCTKDIPFAALMTLYTLRLYRAFSQRELLRSPRFLAGTVAVGVFAMLFRNNAPYALLLLLSFAVFLAGRGFRARMAALLAATLLFSLGAGKALQLATDAQSGLVNEMLSIPAQQLSRVYVRHPSDTVAAEIVEFVPYAEKYNEARADPVKLHLKVSRPGELWGFVKFWGRELLHYPVEYIDAFLQQSRGYWFLDDTLFTRDVAAIYLWFYDNLGVEQTSLLPGLREAMLTLFDQNAYRRVPLLSLLIQPALYTWLCLFALACAVRRRDRALAAGALAALCYLFTLCLGPLVANRYAFYLIAAAPLLVGLMYNLPETGKTGLRR